MMRKVNVVISLGLLAGFVAIAQPPAGAKALQGERVVALLTGLSDEQFIVCSAAIASVNPKAVLLRDSPKMSSAHRAFLTAFKPQSVVPIGPPAAVADLTKRMGGGMAAPLLWNGTADEDVWNVLFPQAENVVLCPSGKRRLLLHSACLAGALKAPLIFTTGRADEAATLRQRFAAWKTRTVYAVADAATVGAAPPGGEVVALADEEVITRLYRRHLGPPGKVRTVVVTNPTDLGSDLGRMSILAPWLAVTRSAALVLTNAKGTNTAAAVEAASEHLKIEPDTLIILATLKAIPTERRPNPVKGKDVDIEMEPLTPEDELPFSFATGRLFHDDPGLVLVQLARNRLLEAEQRPRKALVVSNPGGGLPLLETFSRHTAHELRNGGYQTTAWFGEEVSKEAMRKALSEQDIFLWEGHYKTLIEEFKFLTWDEPLRPSLFFLQSCLALKEAEADPLFQRGAVAVVGSSTRTYSATGGAFTLAFFNALLYDQQSLGGALRQAKNFLLTYSLLKEKRLGEKAKLKGVNVRSSWAFTLWGDPMLKLPQPKPPAAQLEAVQKDIKSHRLTIALPGETYEKVQVGRYEAEMMPNARMAGLLRIDAENEDNRYLVPFVFAEVPLPRVPAGSTPELKTRIPGRNWVFTWDERRKTGYLLVTPRRKDEGELQFRVMY